MFVLCDYCFPNLANKAPFLLKNWLMVQKHSLDPVMGALVTCSNSEFVLFERGFFCCLTRQIGFYRVNVKNILSVSVYLCLGLSQADTVIFVCFL